MTEDSDWKRRFEDKIDKINISVNVIAVQSERITNAEEKIVTNKKSIDENWSFSRTIEKDVAKLKSRSATIWVLLVPIVMALLALTFKIIFMV